MFDIIAGPMGSVLRFIYDNIAFQNYGIAIIVFTLFVKTLMLPLSVKQQRSAEKMREFQPQIKAIQQKYKSNPEQLSAKMQKLYKENKISPMGGLLPMVVQLPIMFSLYYAISQPLKYMAGKSAETIEKLFAMIPEGAGGMERMKDISIISYFGENSEAMNKAGNLLSMDELFNLNFLGIDLGGIPSRMFADWMHPEITGENLLLLLIPLLAALTSYIASKYMMSKTQQIDGDDMYAGMQNKMALISPLMSGIFTFTMPAGLGLYWIIGNVYQIMQQVFMNMFVLKKIKKEIPDGNKRIVDKPLLEEES